MAISESKPGRGEAKIRVVRMPSLVYRRTAPYVCFPVRQGAPSPATIAEVPQATWEAIEEAYNDLSHDQRTSIDSLGADGEPAVLGNVPV